MSKTFFPNRGNHPEDGSGVSIAFPDVCKTPTPGGPIAIPYPHIQSVEQARKEIKKVKLKGQPVAGAGATKFKMSTGNESGTHKGLVSGKSKGKAKFVMHSSDVKFEGKDVVTLSTPMHSNQGRNAAPHQTKVLLRRNALTPPGPGTNASQSQQSVDAILDAIEHELAEYQKTLNRASSLNFPMAQKAQNDTEAKLKNLLSQLEAATAGDPQRNSIGDQVRQQIIIALRGPK